jgi:LacI family xylobiose transport system transcriptional regulator
MRGALGGYHPCVTSSATPKTLADIARAAGVSAPTVSKVLNGRADVAPGTRERVEELLREYGYRRRAVQAAPLLDLVFHELESAWAMEVIRGAEQVAHEEGLSLVLSQSAGRLTPGQSWLDGVLARRPTGVLLVLSKLDPGQREQLVTRDIPFAVIDPAGDLEPDVPAVGAGPDRMLCSRARVDGYRAGLETAGLPFDPALVRAGDFHHEAGYACGLELLRLPDRPTAVFAGNDLQALGLYEAARELGLRIPQDLSVVGFDDLPAARLGGEGRGRGADRARPRARPQARRHPDRIGDRADRPQQHRGPGTLGRVCEVSPGPRRCFPNTP